MSDEPHHPERSASSRKGVPHSRPRKRLNCEPCRGSKLRCDRKQPCSACVRRECVEDCCFRPSRNRITTSSRPRASDSFFADTTDPQTDETTLQPDTSALTLPTEVGPQQPTSLPSLGSLDSVLERPTVFDAEQVACDGAFELGPQVPLNEFLNLLPPGRICEYLISRYFTYQAALFNILHGPTFQDQYHSFTRHPEAVSFSWLSLLLVVCSTSILTLEEGDLYIADYRSTLSSPHQDNNLSLYRHLRKQALHCLSRSEFIVRYDLHTLESLLIMIYGICHSEGVDRGWGLLGIALNIGIALRCNADRTDLSLIDQERRRRCWTGILLLHTYQGLLFRDIDTSFLLKIQVKEPADVEDSDIRENEILEPSRRPTRMSLVRFRLRLFEISSQVCPRYADISSLDDTTLLQLNQLIDREQKEWETIYLANGKPDLLNVESYAAWCILQTYTHQMSLIIHRPFYHSQAPRFSLASRRRYLQSAVDLLETIQKVQQLPILQPYKWLCNGMMAFNTLQGTVALAACLMDRPGYESSTLSYGATFNQAVELIGSLKASSPICAKGHAAVHTLQAQLSAFLDSQAGELQVVVPQSNELDFEYIDWDFWDSFIRQGD